MKYTKKVNQQLAEFMAQMTEPRCVPCDKWTTGRGRYTKPRALPPFVYKVKREHVEKPYRLFTDLMHLDAALFFEHNPRRQKVLVLEFGIVGR